MTSLHEEVGATELGHVTTAEEAQVAYDAAIRHWTGEAVMALEKDPVEHPEDREPGNTQRRHAKMAYRLLKRLESGIVYPPHGSDSPVHYRV